MSPDTSILCRQPVNQSIPIVLRTVTENTDCNDSSNCQPNTEFNLYVASSTVLESGGECLFVVGKGWSFVHVGTHTCFICWEGATGSKGAYTQVVPRIATGWRWTSVLPEPSGRYLQRSNSSRRGFVVDDLPTKKSASSMLLSESHTAQRSTAIVGTKDKSRRVMTLASPSIVPEGRAGVKFDKVLTWLLMRRDHVTAASIGLCLLGEYDTIRDLRKAVSSNNTGGDLDQVSSGGDIDEDVLFASLLDGLDTSLFEPVMSGTDGGGDDIISTSTLTTNLANMTIDCLVEGGKVLSQPLLSFLAKNKDYNPALVSERLVHVMKEYIDTDSPSEIASRNGEVSVDDGNHGIDWDSVIWPLQALMDVGVARHYLSDSMLLLNTVLPNELRALGRDGPTRDDTTRMALAKAIVGSIVRSSEEAVGLLLGLETGDPKQRYWNSLNDETRMALLFVPHGDTFPLLNEVEVRLWVVDFLKSTIGKAESDDPGNSNGGGSFDFLENVATSCLANAGVVLHKDGAFSPLFSFGIETNVGVKDDDAAETHLQHCIQARCLFAEAAQKGFDFELFILAILLMTARHQQEWCGVSCQVLLDAACDCGRQSQTHRLGFDTSIAAQTCIKLGNISATSSLVGGREGLVLKCCDVLRKEQQAEIDDTERFLLGNDFIPHNVGHDSDEVSAAFVPTVGHMELLFILYENVCGVRTYGQFYEGSKVDPVFAARVCFRAWMKLENSTRSSQWLVQWLRFKLGFTSGSHNKHRLACAAIIKALLWTSGDLPNDETIPEKVLASSMELESDFLVEMAKSCSGLVECLHDSVLESLFVGADT